MYATDDDRRTFNAVVVVLAEDRGFHPCRCNVADAAVCLLVADLILGTERGREIARRYIEQVMPEHTVLPTLHAVEDDAVKVVTPAFLERVRLLAAHEH